MNMQITVFGAGGKVGKQVVGLALSRNYSVVAVVHRHNPFQSQAGLTVMRGDIYKPADVAQAMQGSQAIVSTLGSWHTKNKDVLASAMQAIIPAMHQQAIRRIITVTGSGAAWQEDRPTWLSKLNHSLLSLFIPAILRDGEAHLTLLGESGLDWTCLRAPIMTNSSSAAYTLQSGQSLPLIISRRAVATALLDQITQTDFLQAAPVIHRSH